MGDSLAVGVQANPADGTSVITDQGYPDQLVRKLTSGDDSPTLVKLGCPGETTATMIHGGICPNAQGNQLGAAMAFLRAHRGHMRYLTINLGSNDVLRCVSFPSSIVAACLGAAIIGVQTNLAAILATAAQRIAGGPHHHGRDELLRPTAGRLDSQSQLGHSISRRGHTLNAVETAVYRGSGFSVAPVAEYLRTNDFSPVRATGLPVNVTAVCALTWMCVVQNIHPNRAGYALIAWAFLAVLRCLGDGDHRQQPRTDRCRVSA